MELGEHQRMPLTFISQSIWATGHSLCAYLNKNQIQMLVKTSVRDITPMLRLPRGVISLRFEGSSNDAKSNL